MAKTTINVTNITIIAPAYQAIVGSPVPQGAGVIDLIRAMETAQTAKLKADWSRGPYPGQALSAIMGPWSPDLAGTAPACVVQELTTSFEGWGIPTDGATQIAVEITTQIGSNGGFSEEFFGRWSEGVNAELDYGLEYGILPIDEQGTQGVIYSFSAALVAD